MSSSILQKNSSFKKITTTYKNTISKPKNADLLLTDFNKFPLVHSKAKTTKKKTNINHQTYSNNSNNVNYLYENIGKKIGYKLINHNTNKINRQIKGYNINKEIKNIDILDNNMPKKANESMKCNSVNNLIGININVNYLNKNYSINKLKHNSKKTNYDNSYNIYNNNSKIIHNNISSINNSFNDINSGNLPNSSSSKTNINKKNIFIVNQLNQDWDKIIKNLKSKKRNKSKIINIEQNKSEKLIQNFIEENNLNTFTEENISSKTNNNIIEKCPSCKNINYIKEKKLEKQNKFINIYQNMNTKINQIKNNNYNNKLIKIINEYFIEYNKQIEDQYQKKLISEIFDHMNNILKEKEDQIINLKKENEKINKLNKILKEKNEDLSKNNNIKNININNSQEKNNSVISSSLNDSSSVNSEELESIRFFDKIIMKKNSFSNIPELSFKKLYKNKIEKNDAIPQRKNNIIKRNSFHDDNKKNNEMKKFNLNGNKKYMNKNMKNITNTKLNLHKRKINEKNERHKPNIKSFINIFEKSRNKK